MARDKESSFRATILDDRSGRWSLDKWETFSLKAAPEPPLVTVRCRRIQSCSWLLADQYDAGVVESSLYGVVIAR